MPADADGQKYASAFCAALSLSPSAPPAEIISAVGDLDSIGRIDVELKVTESLFPDDLAVSFEFKPGDTWDTIQARLEGLGK